MIWRYPYFRKRPFLRIFCGFSLQFGQPECSLSRALAGQTRSQRVGRWVRMRREKRWESTWIWSIATPKKEKKKTGNLRIWGRIIYTILATCSFFGGVTIAENEPCRSIKEQCDFERGTHELRLVGTVSFNAKIKRTVFALQTGHVHHVVIPPYKITLKTHLLWDEQSFCGLLGWSQTNRPPMAVPDRRSPVICHPHHHYHPHHHHQQH